MRYYKLIGLVLTIVLMTACNNKLVHTSGELEDTQSKDEKQVEHPHEHKDRKPLVEIIANELYRWTIDNDKEIVLVKKSGEIEVNESLSMVGDEGDEMFSGVAELYLILDGADEGYLEDEVEMYMLNLDRTFSDTYQFAEKTFIDIFISESSNIRSHRLWYFTNNQLQRVTFDGEKELYTSNNTLKFIDNEYMQSVVYDNAGMGEHGIGWHFHTWIWEADHNRFSEYDHRPYTANQEYGWEIGEMIAENWYEYEHYYVQFPRITFTEKDVKLIEQGMLVDKSVQIGDSIDKLFERMTQESDYVEEDYYNGGAYYAFSSLFSYFYDEQLRDIHIILMAGTALTNDVQSIRQLLGEPIESSFSDMENVYIDQFIVGDYMVKMDHDAGEVHSLELSIKPAEID